MVLILEGKTIRCQFFFFLSRRVVIIRQRIDVVLFHTLVTALYVSVDGTRSNGFIFVFLKFLFEMLFLKHTYAIYGFRCVYFIIRISSVSAIGVT